MIQVGFDRYGETPHTMQCVLRKTEIHVYSGKRKRHPHLLLFHGKIASLGESGGIARAVHFCANYPPFVSRLRRDDGAQENNRVLLFRHLDNILPCMFHWTNLYSIKYQRICMLGMRFIAEWCHRATQKAFMFANATNESPRFVLDIWARSQARGDDIE